MEVVRGSDNVRFDFGVGSKSARVMGIDVFEADAGKRGNTVCKLSRSVWTGPMDMQSWVYGTPIGWFQPAVRLLRLTVNTAWWCMSPTEISFFDDSG